MRRAHHLARCAHEQYPFTSGGGGKAAVRFSEPRIVPSSRTLREPPIYEQFGEGRERPGCRSTSTSFTVAETEASTAPTSTPTSTSRLRGGRRGRSSRRSSSRLDRLEQVVGLVRELEVGVARDPETAPLHDLHPRRAPRGVEYIPLDRTWSHPSPTAMNPQPLRPLHPRDAPLPRLRVAGRGSRGSATGPRCTGRAAPTTASGVSTGQRRASNHSDSLSSGSSSFRFDYPGEDNALLSRGRDEGSPGPEAWTGSPLQATTRAL